MALTRAHLTGPHRTLSQDPVFAIDQLVEIAIRALSPAVNDTFTALTCIDWLSAGLSQVSSRVLSEGVYRDEHGRIRLIEIDPSYPRMVNRAFDKIRQSARGMPAVIIRMLGALHPRRRVHRRPRTADGAAPPGRHDPPQCGVHRRGGERPPRHPGPTRHARRHRSADADQAYHSGGKELSGRPTSSHQPGGPGTLAPQAIEGYAVDRERSEGMADLLLADEREAVASASRHLAEAGLVIGTAGNISARRDDLIAVTPTGADLATVTAEMVTVIDLDGEFVDGELAPTSEVPLHTGIYAATPALAITHAHAMASTALSCCHDELPPLHYSSLSLGGAPRTAPYATFGSEGARRQRGQGPRRSQCRHDAEPRIDRLREHDERGGRAPRAPRMAGRAVLEGLVARHAAASSPTRTSKRSSCRPSPADTAPSGRSRRTERAAQPSGSSLASALEGQRSHAASQRAGSCRAAVRAQSKARIPRMIRPWRRSS